MSVRAVVVSAVAVLCVMCFAGCRQGGGSDLVGQWEASNQKGRVSADGTSLSIAPGERTDPVVFEGESDQGSRYGSADTRGSVTVVNFWFAGCGPCRAEASDLKEAYDVFGAEGVKFVGVNTRDQFAQAQQFAQQFKIEYPSIIDVRGGRAVQRAFSGQVPLNAVPTTVVLDVAGRVAHRVIGRVDGSQLRTLITETLDEQG